MRRLIWLQTSIVGVLLVLRAYAGANPVGIEQRVDGAKDSIYTQKVIDLIHNWPPSDIPSPSDKTGPFWIEAIRTKGNSSYIGLRKRLYIHAPMSRVSPILEDFAAYPSVHSEVEEVRVTEHEANRWVTSWVRHRPAFFLPKIRYEQIYISRESEEQKVYRYEFKSGNALNYSDGVIVLEPAPDGTYVTSYDFFEGNFGIAKLFTETKIWNDCLEGYARADYELKIKAENPDWSLGRIQSHVDTLMKRFPFRGGQVHYLNGLEISKRN